MSKETSAAVLDTVEALMAARPLSVEGVSRILGVSLEHQPERSNPYFGIHTSARQAGMPVAEVELRLPASPDRDGLLVVALSEEVPIGKQEVMDRFGSRPELSVPTPREPPSAPLYLVYRFGWGDVRFGFERGGRELLRRIVLDATSPQDLGARP